MNVKETFKRQLLHASIIGFWLVLVAISGAIALPFDGKPGTVGSCPNVWPLQSKIERANHKLTLLMFLHPHCYCSRASVSELEKIVSRAQGRIDANVLFISYSGQEKDWQHSALWDAANAIPGVSTKTDPDGEEASLFAAMTSGQTLLYDENGKLLFQGGITAARGHEGDNVGQQTVENLALKREGKGCTNLVFGCPLFNKTDLR